MPLKRVEDTSLPLWSKIYRCPDLIQRESSIGQQFNLASIQMLSHIRNLLVAINVSIS